MSKKIAIITDTGADCLDEAEKLGIDYVSLYITFDGNNYLKQQRDVSIEEFYEKMKDPSIKPKTSLPSVMDFCDKFNEYLDKDYDILYLALDSKFSGTYQASLSARDLILEERPDARIEIFDSLSCTFNLFSMARKAKELADQNKSMEDIIKVMEIMRKDQRVFVTVDSLDALKNSGRLSNFSAALGSLLQIKPILKYEDGVLAPTEKVKGLNKALKTVINNTKDYLKDNIKDYKLAVIHGNHLDNAKEFANDLAEELGIDINDIEFCNMGVCIGLHGGETILAIGMVKDNIEI